MYVRRRRTRIDIWTPAKLNLFLEVLRRRDDGFHEIETLMVPISLYDTLTFSRPTSADQSLTFSAEWVDGIPHRESTDTDVGPLPTGDENLAYQAVAELRRRALHEGMRCDALDVRLRKRTPSAAGLGGGSSDAAAALVGANAWWRLNWGPARLAQIASKLGSDVPFFLHGCLAVCRGRGEQVSRLECGIGRMHFVVVRPPHSLSTADVYRRVQIPRQPHRVETVLDSLQSGRVNNWAPRVFNRLQEAAIGMAPWLDFMRRQFQDLRLLGHQLSGSGSSYFGVCRNRKQACQAAATLRSRGVGRAYAVTSVGGRPFAALQPSQN